VVVRVEGKGLKSCNIHLRFDSRSYEEASGSPTSSTFLFTEHPKQLSWTLKMKDLFPDSSLTVEVAADSDGLVQVVQFTAEVT